LSEGEVVVSERSIGAAPVIHSFSGEVDEGDDGRIDEFSDHSVLDARIQEECEDAAGSEERISFRTHFDMLEA